MLRELGAPCWSSLELLCIPVFLSSTIAEEPGGHRFRLLSPCFSFCQSLENLVTESSRANQRPGIQWISRVTGGLTTFLTLDLLSSAVAGEPGDSSLSRKNRMV
jgi:hypothetical protein